MLRRLAALSLLLAGAAGTAAAQLPLVTAPAGALRIDLSGAFYPSHQAWSNGTRKSYGELFDGPSNIFVSSLQSQLSTILGHPVTGLSTGGSATLVSPERGVGDIGLAYGLSSRITLFANAPIVFVRTRVTPRVDPARASVGLNPAHPVAGSAAGQQQTSGFFTKFDAALQSLGARVAAGDYDGDPAQLALAQQTLSSAATMRAQLFTLLEDPVHADPLLPVATDPAGLQLLGQISALQSIFSTQLGVGGFTATPALPAAAMTPEQYAALISSPSGFGQDSPNNLPRYVLGDVTAGVAVQLLRNGRVGASSRRSLWLRGTGRFPTAAAPDQTLVLDQATGDAHPAVQLDAIAEVGRRRMGLRGEVSYQHAFAANTSLRVTSPDQALVPASSLASIRSRPGDSMAIAVRPFLAFAPHLAVTGLAQYWSRSASHSDYLGSQVPIEGVDPMQLDVGSSANAFVVGFGLSYSHDGTDRDGNPGMPVEAGWSIERTVASGHGIFPAALTTRVTLRLYRPIVKH